MRILRRLSCWMWVLAWPVAVGLGFAATAGVAVLKGQVKPSRDPAPQLAMNVADGFTLAAVGDLIIARPIPLGKDPSLMTPVKILRDADATFGNFEGSVIDIRRFKGYPAAEFGGVWIIGPRDVVKNLKDMGFDVVSRANNHTTDWGLDGMRDTDAALEEGGLVHAGTGENRAAARAARYFDTERGRVALVSMASSFTALSRAMPPVGEAPGRPGLNALRVTRHNVVTRETLETLRKIRTGLQLPGQQPPANEAPDRLNFFSASFRVGDTPGVTYEMDATDQREILSSIRNAKENSDFVIATIHAHDPGNFSDIPADFLPALAHAAIDNGADEFVGHGPHRLRGIEIYKGKPIFYSLGNYFFELNLLEPVGMDLYEQYKADPSQLTDAEFSEFWRERTFPSDVYYQSVIAVSRYERGQVSEIRLYPMDLGYAMRDGDRGVPRLAPPGVARAILERLQKMSQPYGTTIGVEQNVGVIRLKPITATGNRPQSR
jgi:poly-gamma-glutamate capsule biosynthesis protein CapA/YwtB (metallophosphatase superfamily)